MAASEDSCDATSSSTARRSTLSSEANFCTSLTCLALRPVVPRMLAYTVCPERARARAARAPKPLDAPVMRMIDFIELISKFDCDYKLLVLDTAAIDAEGLAVDPAAVRANEEGNRCRNVLRLAKPLQRGKLCNIRDLVIRLSFQEQVGCGRAGSHGIYQDVAPAKFLRKNVRHDFDRRFGPGINRITGHRSRHNAGRGIDNASCRSQPFCRKTQGVECALNVDSQQPVKQCVIRFRQRNQTRLHDTGIIDENIHAAEDCFYLVEHGRHLSRA